MQTQPPQLDDHLKQLLALSKQVNKHMAQLGSVHQDWIKSMRPQFEAISQYRESIRPLLQQAERFREVLGTAYSPVVKRMAEYQSAIQQAISPIFLDLNERFKELPHRTQEALLSLGQHGWYLDLRMSLPALWRFKRAVDEGDIEGAEIALAAHFEDNLDLIEESIIESLPHRAHIIKPAFAAHRRGEYVLAIPVLLSQADGICKETVDRYLFRSENKKPQTAQHVATIEADTFTAAIMSPLAAMLPINATEKERPEGFSALNRHLVLHGDALDFGTKINSLKTISLICYITSVLTAPQSRAASPAEE